MRYNLIFYILSIALKHIGILFLIPAIVAILLHENKEIVPFIATALISILIGFIFSINNADKKDLDNIKKTESLATVLFAWVLFGLICTIPYLFYDFSFTNACFEAVSGITTTGGTIIQNFNLYPKTLFFYRSLTQWIGGMGIVVLFIAVLPNIAVAGRQMFYAEAPAPTEDKATPRIRFTASWLWGLYLTFTVLEVIVLKFLGLDLYNAVVTSLSTIATGGLSPLSGGIVDYNSVPVSICVLIFMYIAGINYILIYRIIKNKSLKPLFKSEEFRVYTGIIIILSLCLTISLCVNSGYEFNQALLNSFFEIVTTMTTTGFAVDNYINWDTASKAILFLAFFTGGCAMSTSGGIKIIRWIFVFKYLKRELNKIIHPKGVYPIKLENSVVNTDIITQMVAFIAFYFAFLALGTFLITIVEKNSIVAITTSATAIGNIGPAYGAIGPMDSFFPLHTFTKWVLIFLMLIGRLEIIPFLAILNKDLWKN